MRRPQVMPTTTKAREGFGPRFHLTCAFGMLFDIARIPTHDSASIGSKSYRNQRFGFARRAPTMPVDTAAGSTPAPLAPMPTRPAPFRMAKTLPLCRRVQLRPQAPFRCTTNYMIGRSWSAMLRFASAAGRDA